NVAAAVGIHEIRNGAAEKISLGEKVGVENGDEFALGGFQTVFQGSGFVTFAIGPMNVDDGHALCGVALDASASDVAGLVGGIVEDLHVEEVPRVVETRNSFDEPLDDVALVEDGQLHSDARPIRDRRRSRGDIFGIREIVVDQPVAVQAVNGEDQEDDEVGNHHRQVESVGVIDAGKGSVGELVPIKADGVLSHENNRE